jgi:hypothetical protein
VQHLYEKQLLLATDDAHIPILAGSCLGGGSTVNWSASFRTPAHVRREWVERFGLHVFAPGKSFDQALDYVCEKSNVNIDYSHRNESIHSHPGLKTNLNNELLYRGATALKHSCKPIPRNVRECVNCGSCCHGCPYRAKQSTVVAYLETLREHDNLRILTWAHADSIIIEKGSAVGVAVTASYPIRGSEQDVRGVGASSLPDDTWGKLKINVQAKVVVSSAGAIHSPALLLRSGLKHPKIGRHLCLHPVLGVGGIFPTDDTGLSDGVGMGTYVDDFMSMNQSGYGVAAETPPLHPAVSVFSVRHRACISVKLSLFGIVCSCFVACINRFSLLLCRGRTPAVRQHEHCMLMPFLYASRPPDNARSVQVLQHSLQTYGGIYQHHARSFL